MIASHPNMTARFSCNASQLWARSEDHFFETAKEIRSRQRLSGFDLPVCNFLRIGIDERGSCCITRVTRIAERKRHIGTMKTVSARQANHEFSTCFRVWNTERKS